jgi:uncharacterized protein Yka (UPF0111/DUF47 family)
MWRRLRPRELSFFSDFECQAHYARRAATLLPALVEDFADVPGAAKAIKDVEHAGDDVAHAVIARLHVTWVTPIDRHDIHTLAIRLDDVLDYLHAAASAFRVYRVKQPTPECRALMNEVVERAAGGSDRPLRGRHQRHRGHHGLRTVSVRRLPEPSAGLTTLDHRR